MQAKCPPYVFFRGVMPSWDNTARRQDSGHIFLDSSPEAYAHWLESAAEWTARMHLGDERLLFINAWNEWAEGNHLEPDKKNGRAYLEATRTVMQRYNR
jgi:lipopolysaccharide biosynthesis protein